MKKLVAPLSIALGFLGVLLTGFLVSAHAATVAAPDDGNLLDLARPIFDQVVAGHYVAAAAFALVLSVALVKRFAPTKLADYIHTDAGGATTTFLMAFGGALATATVGGAPWTWAMCWAALGVGVAAIGGYTVIKKVIVEPLLRPLMAKLPPWAQPFVSIILWVFDKPALSTATAKAAGTLAVAQHPGTGVDAVAGEPKDL